MNRTKYVPKYNRKLLGDTKGSNHLFHVMLLKIEVLIGFVYLCVKKCDKQRYSPRFTGFCLRKKQFHSGVAQVQAIAATKSSDVLKVTSSY